MSESKHGIDWFERKSQNIKTETTEKRETPYGLWHKCDECSQAFEIHDYKDNLYTCPYCGKHERIDSEEYFEILFDNTDYELCFEKIISNDPLNFKDKKQYKIRLEEATRKSKLSEAISVAKGKLNEEEIIIACMNFSFIGGSMGSVVGERICRAIDLSIETKTPLLIISKSGGARMMEAAYSLMQMAKTSAKLTLLEKNKIPYISLLTDPTTGGVTASFAMLGDVILAEPNALIGFAGPRVIKETIQKKELPKGFQRSETVIETGFVDKIVDRHNLKKTIHQFITFFK